VTLIKSRLHLPSTQVWHKNKVVILGVETPNRRGENSQKYLEFPSCRTSGGAPAQKA
jgi:hypothetical protein